MREATKHRRSDGVGDCALLLMIEVEVHRALGGFRICRLDLITPFE